MAEKKYAVITGGSSGLGFAIGMNLAKKGYTPILIARRRNRLDEAVETIKKAGFEAHGFRPGPARAAHPGGSGQCQEVRLGCQCRPGDRGLPCRPRTASGGGLIRPSLSPDHIAFSLAFPLGTVAAYRDSTVDSILSQSIEKERIIRNKREACYSHTVLRLVADAIRMQSMASRYGRPGILKALSPAQGVIA